jgi:hypothetical protein
MIDCCVAKLGEMHDIADYYWWFQRFMMASPFILLIPDFDPTSGASDLLQTGLQKCGEMAVSKALNHVHKNKSLPDFVDAVKGLSTAKFYQMSQIAAAHAVRHTPREMDMANFWHNLGRVYTEAFTK